MTSYDSITYHPDGTVTRDITPKVACLKDCTFRKRLGGKFTIRKYDKLGNMTQEEVVPNLIVDVGIKHLGDILIGSETCNLCLGFIEPDAGTTAVVVGDTDIQTAVDACCLDRLATSCQARNACSPYEVTIDGFIASCKWTRPFTINKMSVFFGPDESGDMFAAGKLDCPVTMNACCSATITYGIFFR